MRLFDSALHQDLKILVGNTFKSACLGKTDQFLYNIDMYLQYAPNALEMYAQVGRQLLEPLGVKNVEFDTMYLAIWGVLASSLNIMVDMEKEEDGYPSALYCVNIPQLQQLAASGFFVEDTDMDKVIKSFVSKMKKAVEARQFTALRLDVDRVFVGNLRGKRLLKPLYKVVLPRSVMDIGTDKQFALIPLPVMYMLEDIITKGVGENPFRFEKSSIGGDITHIATISPDTVRKVYAGQDMNDVESKIKKTVVGFDVTRLRFMCYDLESSLTTIGAASFRFEMLNKITPVKLSSVDKSQYTVDYDLLRQVYRTRVNNFKTADFQDFKLFDTSTFSNNNDRAEALIEWGNKLSGKELYKIMEQYPHLFQDVNDSLNTRQKLAPRQLKQLVVKELSDDVEKRVEEVRMYLDSGLVRLTMRKKDNSVVDRLVSNNPDILKRFLGADYALKFESIGGRLKEVKSRIRQGEVGSVKDLEALAAEYDILAHVNIGQLLSSKVNEGDFSDSIKALDFVIDDLDEKSKAKKSNPDMVMFRKVYAESEKSFYGQVNVHDILTLEYAPLN